MNNENSSNELFPESGTAEAEAQQTPQVQEAPEKFPRNTAGREEIVITEETDIVEEEIPDTDAGGARSCGEFLKLQREKLGLSYGDVFEATRIKEDIVKALEEEDFSHLPQPVYIIAYVKRLCGFYNINNALAREFIDELRSRISFDVPEDFSKSVKGSDESEENMRRIRNLAIAVILIIFLFLAMIISGITLVILNLRKSGHQLEKTTPYTEKTLVDLQPKPKLKITEL